MYKQITMFEVRFYPNPYGYSSRVGASDYRRAYRNRLIATRAQARKIVRRLRRAGVDAFLLPVTVNVCRETAPEVVSAQVVAHYQHAIA